MKNLITLDVNEQELNRNLSINMTDIKTVCIAEYPSYTCIQISYISGDYNEYFNPIYSNNDYIHMYFKILKYLQDYHNNKNINDFLVFTKNGVNLLSELDIKNI